MSRKGMVLAGGAGSRLHPITLSLSKQLLPVYDKPMIYYPLSVLMLSGIREILIISTPHDLPAFRALLGDGSAFGLELSYAEQPSPDGLAQAFLIGRDFLDGAPSCLILGDNLFFGHELPKMLGAVSAQTAGATIFAYHVSDPQRYGIVEFDAAGRAVSIEEKPAAPRSSFAVPGLYYYDESAPRRAAALKPSPRGELEITDLNLSYMNDGLLNVSLLGRGTAWLDTGTHESLLEASQFVQTIQKRQGLMISCLEEIAWRKKWIDVDGLKQQVARMGRSTYADYLRRLAEAS
ncbi:MAG: glucose-1-phosphate thymidylyltransferase RfbA [Candidatus Methylacidiphilales bacterium]